LHCESCPGGRPHACEGHTALACCRFFWHGASRCLSSTSVRWLCCMVSGDAWVPERRCTPLPREHPFLGRTLREYLCGQPDFYHHGAGPASALRAVWCCRHDSDYDRPARPAAPAALASSRCRRAMRRVAPLTPSTARNSLAARSRFNEARPRETAPGTTPAALVSH